MKNLILMSVACCLIHAGCSKDGGDAAKAAAAAYPTKAIPAKGLEALVVGLPPGASIEPGGAGLDDRAVVTASGYNLLLKPGKAGTNAKMKTIVGKMKTWKSFPVSGDDGFIAELDEPSGKQFMVMREVSVEGTVVECSNPMAKPAATIEKAQEAFAVCGTLKKK